MRIKQQESIPQSENTTKKVKKRRIVGYRFEFAPWVARYQKELGENKIVSIDNEISINRQSIQSVENSIYSKALGELPDTDRDIREFSCGCGEMFGRFFEGEKCKVCGTLVQSRFSTDIKRVGWISVEPFFVINPNAYEVLGKIIGLKNLSKILQYDIDIGIDGNLQTNAVFLEAKNKIPYQSIGILEFREKFEEIVKTYAQMRGKHEDAAYILKHKDLVFSNVIPVSSIYLRPTFTSSKKRSVSFDKINAIYIKIISNVKLVKRIIRKEVEMKRALNIMFDIQMSMQELYANVIKTKLSGKPKIIRGSVLGNRMNFSSRMVIRSFTGPYSGIDKVEVGYKGFLELYLLEILNALINGYGNAIFTTMTAYEILRYLTICEYKDTVDEYVWEIIQLFLKKRKYNPLAINRPPTLDLGSIQTFQITRVIKDAREKTLGLPLSSLKAMNADFDGDNLSVFAPKELCVIEAMIAGFSPKSLIIDRTGDRYFNGQFGVINDEITSLYSLLARGKRPPIRSTK